MANKLISSILKNHSKLLGDGANVLSEAGIAQKIVGSTKVPLIDAMLCGHVDGGGLVAGNITQLVGDSRTFKSNFLLLMMKAFLDFNPEAIAVLLNSEGGITDDYVKAMGIDPDRVLNIAIFNVEELAQKAVTLAKDFHEQGLRNQIFWGIDSIGALDSVHGATQLEKGDGSPSFTRAKLLNSFWRVFSPYVKNDGNYCTWINSFYEEMGNKYAEANLGGGKEGKLLSDNIWFITRRQISEDVKGATGDLSSAKYLGWEMVINSMKGRWVREKSKAPITVKYDQGIYQWSGLLDVLKWFGMVENSGAYYKRTAKSGINDEKGTMKKDMDDDWYMALMEQPEVVDTLNKFYSLNGEFANFSDFQIEGDTTVDLDAQEKADKKSKK